MKLNKTKDEIKEIFILLDSEISISKIAKKFNVSEITIRRMKRDGLEKTLNKKFSVCEKCKKEFIKYTRNQRFCSSCSSWGNYYKLHPRKKRKKGIEYYNNKIDDFFKKGKQ